MQKIILALSVYALVPAVYVAVAHAEEYEDVEFVEEETRSVTKRVTCDDIQSEMNSLNAMDALSDEDSARLDKLKSEYRVRCGKKSANRSMTRRSKVTVTEIVEKSVPDSDGVNAEIIEKSVESVSSTCDVPDENGCCPGEVYTDLGEQGFNCCTENNEHCFPPMNKNPQKCDDGADPDANGCCVGETYTDLGEQGFNCCLSDGLTCFPPIKK